MSSAPGTPEPKSPAPVARLGEHWDRIALAPHSEVFDAAAGASGWVVVGRRDCCTNYQAAAWTMSDGLSLTEATVEDAADTILSEVSWTGAAFYALGNTISTNSDGTARSTAGVWTSVDGRLWKHIASIDLASCPVDGDCASPRAFSVSAEGVFVIGGVDFVRGDPIHFRSVDGTSWTPIESGAFGRKPTLAAGTIAAAPGIILAGACDGCPMTLWGSADGARWTKAGVIQETRLAYLSMATDGNRLLVAGNACPKAMTEGEGVQFCPTKLWAAVGRGPLEALGPVAPGTELAAPKLTYTGSTFVLAGEIVHQFLVSPDGRTWEDRQVDPEAFNDCGATGLVGGANQVIAFGSLECPGIWMSRGD